MVSYTTGVATGLTLGGLVYGTALYNRPIYGLANGLIQATITVALRHLFGKTVSNMYLAGLIIYTIGLVGQRAQELHLKKPIPILQNTSFTSDDRKKIAQETLKCIQDGFYKNPQGYYFHLRPAQLLYNKSVAYVGEVIPEINRTRFGKTEVAVVKRDCMEVAQEEAQKGAKVALVNFASPIEPGGGFEEGTNGQEEQLCYSSELAGLMKQVLIEFQKEEGTHLFPLNNYQEKPKILKHYKTVYTSEVNFFRSNGAHGYQFLDAPFKVAVISSAPAVTPLIETMEDGSVDYRNINDLHYMRLAIAHQLHAAYDQRQETVILGAFGCGAFKNPPHAVAKIYKEEIEAHFNGAFKKIIFAIVEDPYNHGPHNPMGNFKPFEECFKNFN